MSDTPETPAPVWAALTAKVKQLEDAFGANNMAINDLRSDVANGVVATQQKLNNIVANVGQQIDLIYHLIRTARAETREQFQLTLARAQMEMQAPPEMDAIAQMRAQMEAQKQEIQALKEAMRAAPAPVEIAPPAVVESVKVRKATTKAVSAPVNAPASPVVLRNRPAPADFAPANIVPPPPIRGDDTDIPKREMIGGVPAGMRFEEGR